MNYGAHLLPLLVRTPVAVIAWPSSWSIAALRPFASLYNNGELMAGPMLSCAEETVKEHTDLSLITVLLLYNTSASVCHRFIDVSSVD